MSRISFLFIFKCQFFIEPRDGRMQEQMLSILLGWWSSRARVHGVLLPSRKFCLPSKPAEPSSLVPRGLRNYWFSICILPIASHASHFKVTNHHATRSRPSFYLMPQRGSHKWGKKEKKKEENKTITCLQKQSPCSRELSTTRRMMNSLPSATLNIWWRLKAS